MNLKIHKNNSQQYVSVVKAGTVVALGAGLLL